MKPLFFAIIVFSILVFCSLLANKRDIEISHKISHNDNGYYIETCVKEKHFYGSSWEFIDYWYGFSRTMVGIDSIKNQHIKEIKLYLSIEAHNYSLGY